MKQKILNTLFLLFAITLSSAGETANYILGTFYGNDGEPLLTAIQSDETFKA